MTIVTLWHCSFLHNFQLVVVAYDRASPEQTAQTEVQISVRRNENAPEFTRTLYTATVPAHAALGTQVAAVTASDADQVRMTWCTYMYTLLNVTENSDLGWGLYVGSSCFLFWLELKYMFTS